MQRRHFVKLTSASIAALLFSRVTYAGNSGALMDVPAEVWAQTGGEWFKLKPSGHNIFTDKDIEVALEIHENYTRVYAQSPTMGLTGVRLKWHHKVAEATKVLGDNWERTYGDAGWKATNAATKNPWYVLLHDDKQTACFGVKTGCNAICWWTVSPEILELTLDTHSGGVGVELGNRKLLAADIVTTQSTPTETPFFTARRFCSIMCEKTAFT